MSFLKRRNKKKCADSEKSPPMVMKLEPEAPVKLEKVKPRTNLPRVQKTSIEWM